MIIQENQLKEFLIDTGLVTESDYEKAEKESLKNNLPVGQVLISDGKINEDDFHRAEAYAAGIPFVSFRDEKLDPLVLAFVPEPIARKNNIIAFNRSGDSLDVAVLDVKDFSTIDFIKNKFGFRISPYLTDTHSMKNALLQYQKSLKNSFGDSIQKYSLTLKGLVDKFNNKDSESDIRKAAEDPAVIRVLENMYKHAIMQEATDIHLDVLENELLIRYRIDGCLYDAMVLPKNITPVILAKLKLSADLNPQEKSLPQSGNLEISEEFFAKISILPTYFGEKVTLRLFRKIAPGFNLEMAGFQGEALDHLHEVVKQRRGLILAAGPKHSGRTATIYTLLDMLNTPRVNICTIEDPIEFQVPRVSQTQVRPEIGLTFAAGLRSISQQDSDVIMVGEISDEEVALLTANLALAGRLVLATFNTSSISETIAKLLRLKLDPALVASTLKLITNQRLARKLTQDNERYFLSKSEIAMLEKIVDLKRIVNLLRKEKIIRDKDTIETTTFYRPRKNISERDSYAGQICLCEVYKMSEAVKDLIITGKTDKIIEQQIKKEIGLSLAEDGIYKAAQGLTSLEEVLRVISE